MACTIDRTCQEVGFFTITGHGVPVPDIDALRVKAHGFFALPLAEKRKAIHPVPATPRGYRALGIEALSYGNDRATPPDLKEYYHFGRESWPAEPPGFAEAAARYYAAMEELAALLMRLTALALGLNEGFFESKIDRHITAMRLNFYPAQMAAPQTGQLRAGEHTDYGAFTILNGENAPGGLQVLTRDGAWIDVETNPANFVVNIGDLLMRWTNDRWVSNMHRVVNPPRDIAASAKRLSIAFFQHPNYDAVIDCIAPPGEAKYPAVRSGEYRDLKYRETRIGATAKTGSE